jgi:hypothetical protein
MGVVMGEFVLLLALAVNVWVKLPTSSETCPAGARIMFAGTGNEVFVVGLLLPQAVSPAIKSRVIKMNPNRTNSNHLPMHPPRPVDPRGELVWPGKPSV